MSEPKQIEEATLGRSLAETAALNAPGYRAATGAADAVRRASRNAAGRAAQRRRFLLALAWLALALVLFAGLAWILQAMGL